MAAERGPAGTNAHHGQQAGDPVPAMMQEARPGVLEPAPDGAGRAGRTEFYWLIAAAAFVLGLIEFAGVLRQWRELRPAGKPRHDLPTSQPKECLATKLLSLNILAGHASTSFEAKDAAAVGRAAQALQFGNLAERHKAPFAAGDALALAGDFGTARIRSEEALGSAAAGPEGCSSDGPAADAGNKLAEAEGRLDRKLEAAEGNGDRENGTPEEGVPAEPEADSPGRDKLEQLAESARESQRERNNGRERWDYLEDTGTGPARIVPGDAADPPRKGTGTAR
jgi:hypothetical protein